MHKFLSKISLAENKRRFLIIKGILSRRYAYRAPDMVQIDLTQRCNSRCFICWLHSPFIEKKVPEFDMDLETEVVKKFITDIAISGTKQIIFSGGGEPFMHPDVWEILEVAEKAGVDFTIYTNLTLLNEEDIKILTFFKRLTLVTVSIWAAGAGLYSELHNRPDSVFYSVENNIRFLNNLKPNRIKTKIYAVINNRNYLQVERLMLLAAKTGCDSIEFGVSDVISGITDIFLLNKGQLDAVRDLFIALQYHKKSVRIFNKDKFLRRITSPRACYGEYDFLNETHRCYAGWFFLRLRANGDFNSCLKSHCMPIGNIYKDNFNSVWNNTLQQEFREKSLHIPKEKDYFSRIGNHSNGGIGCNQLCDNIATNAHVDGILRYTPFV
jgi:MoaA/NifB/PqqE/SkfB family radical SAM enzyme